MSNSSSSSSSSSFSSNQLPTLRLSANPSYPSPAAALQPQRDHHTSSHNYCHLPHPQPQPQPHQATPYPPLPPLHSNPALHYTHDPLLPGRYGVNSRPLQPHDATHHHIPTQSTNPQQFQQKPPPHHAHYPPEFHYPTLPNSAQLQNPPVCQNAQLHDFSYNYPYNNPGPSSHSDNEIRQYGSLHATQPWRGVGQYLDPDAPPRTHLEYPLPHPRTYSDHHNPYPYVLNPPYSSTSYASQPLYRNDMRTQASTSMRAAGPGQVNLQDYPGQHQRQYSQPSEIHSEIGVPPLRHHQRNQSVGNFRLIEPNYEQTQVVRREMSRPVTPEERTRTSTNTAMVHSISLCSGGQTRMPMEYRLVVRQHPKQTRVVCQGDKAIDRKSIDPPPIVQLEYTNASSDVEGFLENPYLFCYAALVLCTREEQDIPGCHVPIERQPKHLSEDLMGSLVSSLHKLKNTDNQDGGYFIFPDMYMGAEGIFRLCCSLFDIQGMNVSHISSVFTDTFVSYSSHAFPGLAPSTFLSRSFSDQGVRIKIRKEHRVQLKRQTKIKQDIAKLSTGNGLDLLRSEISQSTNTEREPSLGP